GTPVREAVDALLIQLPGLRPHWLDKAGELYPHVHIFINGQDVQTLEQGIDSPLNPEDVLDFFPPVGGGSFAF
ncbi:MAG: MoaD/ThiS family protein, partial [Anaerolineaceae bacterium]|nr:MoaD/ThiS family protein [Anaerolineaceae bacterium]